MTISMLMSR